MENLLRDLKDIERVNAARDGFGTVKIELFSRPVPDAETAEDTAFVEIDG